jgi:hypothetical protein
MFLNIFLLRLSIQAQFQDRFADYNRRVLPKTPMVVQVMPRPTIFTQAALASITSLVDQGRSAVEIASELGCTLGTLRVRCSQHGISLRRRATSSREEATTAMNLVPSAEGNPVARRKSVDRLYTVEQSGTVVSESSTEARIELHVLLPQITTEQLRQRGALRGLSGSTLASKLLVTIARDDLYDALLDDASSR